MNSFVLRSVTHSLTLFCRPRIFWNNLLYRTEKNEFMLKFIIWGTGWSISYRKYILQITKPSRYRYAKLQYRFAVISGSPSRWRLDIRCTTSTAPCTVQNNSIQRYFTRWNRILCPIYRFPMHSNIFACYGPSSNLT